VSERTAGLSTSDNTITPSENGERTNQAADRGAVRWPRLQNLLATGRQHAARTRGVSGAGVALAGEKLTVPENGNDQVLLPCGRQQVKRISINSHNPISGQQAAHP
jgi:hypothetical protein